MHWYMAILKGQIPVYREIFAVPGVLSDRFFTFGYQDIFGEHLPADFAFADLKAILLSKGVNKVTTLDYFDERADLRYDMNLPVPAHEHEKYSTVLDIGSLEHVFDTRQCIENCLKMVEVGGIYVLHTCVKGYFGHGLHVFNPEGLLQSLALNNFDIVYLKYTTSEGKVIDAPRYGENVLIWVVAKKLKSLDTFVVPQQSMWKEYEFGGKHTSKKGRSSIKRMLRKFLTMGWGLVLSVKNEVRQFLDR